MQTNPPSSRSQPASPVPRPLPPQTAPRRGPVQPRTAAQPLPPCRAVPPGATPAPRSPEPSRTESLLTVDEVAAWLRVARKTVLNWTYRRLVPHVKFGKRVRFKREDVEAWIASRYKEACDRL